MKIDLDEKSLSFAINDEPFQVAFTELTTPLVPCVTLALVSLKIELIQ